uniref:protein c-Fos-like n=1 Tax=Myxine glutinosa TaxID=7769 RepID=UPI00358E3075
MFADYFTDYKSFVSLDFDSSFGGTNLSADRQHHVDPKRMLEIPCAGELSSAADVRPSHPYKEPACRHAGARRGKDEQVGSEDSDRRRIRRERNRLAAAKIRNNRRDLTEHLEAETTKLAKEQDNLCVDIMELQKEKEELEFLLASHKRSCCFPPEHDQNVPSMTSSSAVQTPQPTCLREVSLSAQAAMTCCSFPLQIKIEPNLPEGSMAHEPHHRHLPKGSMAHDPDHRHLPKGSMAHEPDHFHLSEGSMAHEPDHFHLSEGSMAHEPDHFHLSEGSMAHEPDHRHLPKGSMGHEPDHFHLPKGSMAHEPDHFHLSEGSIAHEPDHHHNTCLDKIGHDWFEDLHTPVMVTSTPNIPALGGSSVFTFPSLSSLDSPCEPLVGSMLRPFSGASDFSADVMLSPSILSPALSFHTLLSL